MRRRRFLGAIAVAGVAGLAGCGEPNGSLSLTRVDDASLADRYASSVDALPPGLAEFVVGVIEDGARTREGSNPPFDRDRPVEHEGVYYRLEYEILETHAETVYVIEADYDPERPVDGPTVAFDDLPPADRAALEDLIPPPEGARPEDGYDLARGHTYPPDAESVLVPEPQYEAVSYDGEAYPIRVERAREVGVHTYQYRAEQVAADERELATTVRDEYRFTLAGLSRAERDVVEAAIDGGYRVESDDEPPEAFQSLLDRFRSHEAIRRDEYDGDWLVRYGGSDYWADVGFPYDGPPTGSDTPAVTPPEG